MERASSTGKTKKTEARTSSRQGENKETRGRRKKSMSRHTEINIPEIIGKGPQIRAGRRLSGGRIH